MTTITVPADMPGLIGGAGQYPAAGACVMQAVAWLATSGQKWTDEPDCAHPVIRRVAIWVNDSVSDKHRRGLWPLVPRIMGTATGDHKADIRTGVALAVWAAERVLPLITDPAAGKRAAEKLGNARAWVTGQGISLPPEPDSDAAATAAAATAAAPAAAYAAAAYAAAAAAYAAAAYDDAAAAADAYAAAAYAADAYAAAAYDAVAAAAAAAAADAYAAAAYAAAAYDDAAAAAAAADAERDRILSQFAEWVVEILIDLKAPGCQFLDLVPLAS